MFYRQINKLVNLYKIEIGISCVSVIILNTIKNCTKYKNRAFKAHNDHLTPYSKIIL